MKLRLIRQPTTVTVTIADNEPFNLAQYGGSAVGAANAIHIQPGTGATFNLGTIGDIATQTTLALIKAKTDNLDTALSTILTELQQKYEGGAITATVNLITGFATSANQLPDGHNVTVDNAVGAGVYVRPGTSTVWDVEDRAARLVGVVYGSQGVQLQQKITSNDLIVTLDGESVAVTGTFWQGTQPVSATNFDIRDLTQVSDSVLIYGSDDGGTTKRVIKTDSGGAIQVDLEVASVTVTSSALPTGAATSALQLPDGHNVTIDNASLAVTGTFYQATQPVSGTFYQATQPVSGTFYQATQPVSGTFYQATQPVSIATAPALVAGTAAIGKLLPPDVDVTTHTNYARKYYTSAGAATDGIIWSPAAAKRWHVVTMYINVSAAATVTLEDDKAGGDDPVWKGELAANSGVVLQFPEKYPMASGEDAADLIITTSAGNVYCTVVGYEI